MKDTTINHLPDNAYWVCNSTYNGLSQLAKFATTFRIADVMIKPFGNSARSRAQASASKISATILNQLRWIEYLNNTEEWYSE